jgi:uncharacterized RDD family membrane protein YckC
MAEGVKQLDSRIEVQTPENIAFQYRAAGPFRRLPAYLADLGIRFLIMLGAGLFVALSFGMVGAGSYASAILILTWFALSWFYGGLFETYWNGQTPGKRMMGIRVVTVDGQPINAMQAVLRNILRAADSAPYFMYTLEGAEMMAIPIPLYQVGLLVPMLTERYQRLGDLACGTMVIVEEAQFRAGMLQIKEPEAIRLAEELPPNIQVSRSLGRALTKYVSRRAAFSRERRAEIARRLAQALCEKHNLPPTVDHDLLLCALYYRAFIGDREKNLAEVSPAVPTTRRGAPLVASR